jgi:UDP-N-acetylglucosamine--N-acetylmuramyl-(pentapeptide) pyrophosphoryl-undecaprenol N-acetylglucosamine transferase
LLYAASVKKIPCLIQEQNSYAGLTNKLLASRVDKICVAHEGMGKYFPEAKLVVTGNPVRNTITGGVDVRSHAMEHFELNPDKKTILIVGGSLGARSVNEMIIAGLPTFVEKDIQVIWQTGSYYYQEMLFRAGELAPTVKLLDFIAEMKLAYAAADVVISRAGALSIAELMLMGKPSILVPSPNVAEDHQTINAKALVDRDAAIMVSDKDGKENLVSVAIQLVNNSEKQSQLAENIKKMAHPNASQDIANEVIKLLS